VTARFEQSACGGVAIVTLSGSLDTAATLEFRRQLLGASRASQVTVLDLGLLHRLDTGVVSALNSAASRVQHRGHRIIAVNAQPHVAAVLRGHAPLIELLAVADMPLDDDPRPSPRPTDEQVGTSDLLRT
jgi:anti-anti-sigma factor